MPIFSNTVLITDLDGTLLPASKELNPRDMEAIEYFRQQGGIFTVATGRIIQAADQFFEPLKPDAPVILNNGGLIYDTRKNEVIYENSLDEAVYGYTEELMEKFPDIGVEVNLSDEIYVIRMTEWERLHLSMTHLPYTVRVLNEIPKTGWCKVLYSVGDGGVIELAEYAEAMNWNKASFVISGDFLFECLPRYCTKGSALERLSAIEGWEKLTVAAAGDYNNDLEMLRFADIAVAPQNAQDIVKRSADYVTSASCENGAIAETVEYLEKTLSQRKMS